MKTEPLGEEGEGSVQTLEESNEEEKTVEEIPIQPKKSKSKHLTKKLGTGSGTTLPVLRLSSTSSSPSSTQSSSSSSEEEKKKMKKRAKKSRKHHVPTSRSRMTSIEGVIHRYKAALKKFNKYGSMKKAFSRIHVDRNTIARTAVIAEIAIMFPDTFQDLLSQHDENETISQFAENCTKAVTTEMAEKITAEKKKRKTSTNCLQIHLKRCFF
ncbi:Coiled-coil domain-containing protein 106 [Collichthys lucidus]|uniref:Coiled-coil domain-containing protein 106 n=1 Tax=Collichthys lucidus TaxID=240159 RepID=A0A4U5VJZ7_COLLU|nr:Coiled-coil domain-containing protein 106 [Collichthys lucidus]